MLFNQFDNWFVTMPSLLLSSKNIHLSNWVAVLGLHSQYGSDYQDRQNLQVDQIIMNEHYNRRTKQADIALMHLKTPANFTGAHLSLGCVYLCDSV